MNTERGSQSRPKPLEGQVLDVSEIEVGKEYTTVDLQKRMKKIKVLTQPHRLEEAPEVEDLYIDVEEDFSLAHANCSQAPSSVNLRISLASFGVIPDANGNWNKTNYLLKRS